MFIAGWVSLAIMWSDIFQFTPVSMVGNRNISMDFAAPISSPFGLEFALSQGSRGQLTIGKRKQKTKSTPGTVIDRDKNGVNLDAFRYA